MPKALGAAVFGQRLESCYGRRLSGAWSLTDITSNYKRPVDLGTLSTFKVVSFPPLKKARFDAPNTSRSRSDGLVASWEMGPGGAPTSSQIWTYVYTKASPCTDVGVDTLVRFCYGDCSSI